MSSTACCCVWRVGCVVGDCNFVPIECAGMVIASFICIEAVKCKSSAESVRLVGVGYVYCDVAAVQRVLWCAWLAKMIHGHTLRRMLDKLREDTQYCMPADPSASDTERRKLSDQLTGEIIQTKQPKEGSKTTGKVVGGGLWRRITKCPVSVVLRFLTKLANQFVIVSKFAESDPTTTASLNDTMPDKIKWLQLEYYEKATGPAK